jgi:uncharacterized membrane protein
MDSFRNVLTLVRSQLWLIPGVIMVAAAGLAWGLLTHGSSISPAGETTPWWLYSGQAATARALLSSLLGGLITMTSLVVSITFVILTLAANQLGPRLIAIFMRDLQIQGVLGLFIGTILYIVLIMRVLDDTLGPEGVPHLAITTGTLLSILCLLALVFYLHKIANLIIADNVVTAVGQELRQTFRSILPSEDEDDTGNDLLKRTEPGQPGWPLSLGRSGYVQVVGYDDLLTLACDHDIRIEVTVRAGHHVLHDGGHVCIYAPEQPSQKLAIAIRAAFTIGEGRTSAQDPEHGIRQLVEIALRALSPGINDPFTAHAVIDELATSLEVSFQRGKQRRVFFDDRGIIRVVADHTDDAGMLAAAFNSIRQAGKAHPAILIHLADIFRKLASSKRTNLQQKALMDQLDRLGESAALLAMSPRDTADLQARIAQARLAVQAGSLRK